MGKFYDCYLVANNRASHKAYFEKYDETVSTTYSELFEKLKRWDNLLDQEGKNTKALVQKEIREVLNEKRRNI